MKKLLLTLATAALGCMALSAAEVKFDFATETYGLTRYDNSTSNAPYIDNGTALTANGGVEVTLTKTEGKNGWRLWNDGLRIYKGSDAGMTVTATENIASITFTTKSGILAAATCNGTETAVSGTSFTITPNSTTATIAFNVSANGAIYTMTVTTGEGGTTTPDVPDTPDTPDVETTGDGTQTNPYTVADLIALGNPGTTAWVKGYIVGVMNYVEGTGNVFSSTELTTGTNIVIAGATTGYGDNIVAVQLPKGDVRTALSLVDHPEIYGKEVSLNGELTAYCGVTGVKNTKSYVLDGQQGGETPTPDTPDTPDTPGEVEGAGTELDPYTVNDVIALGNPATTAWVSGYIVGTVTDKSWNDLAFSADNASNTNIVLAPTADCTDATKCIPVQLPAGSVRDDLSLKNHPGNLGKEVSVYGSLEKYFGQPGVKSVTNYTIVGGIAPEPEAPKVGSLTEFVEEQPTSNTEITGTVTVFYQSADKRYTFITDGTSNLEVYGNLPEYANGDQLTGIIGYYGYYNNMPQMTPKADSFGEATKGTAIDPVEKALSAINPADYVLVKNATISAINGKNATISANGEELALYNQFGVELAEVSNVDLIVIGGVFKENKQVYLVGPADETSIRDIQAAAGAREIYDLQGRKLAAPVRGINIINGQKVLVK